MSTISQYRLNLKHRRSRVHNRARILSVSDNLIELEFLIWTLQCRGVPLLLRSIWSRMFVIWTFILRGASGLWCSGDHVTSTTSILTVFTLELVRLNENTLIAVVFKSQLASTSTRNNKCLNRTDQCCGKYPGAQLCQRLPSFFLNFKFCNKWR